MNSKEIGFYLFCSSLLLMPAFFNGFPLVYSDSGTYIAKGIEMVLPDDRLVLYSLFVRFFSFKLSLWGVVFFQALIVNFVLWHFSKLISPAITKGRYAVLVFILSWFTGLGWYTSLIMPDIFTAVAICCIVMLIYRKNYSWSLQLTFASFLVLSIGVHAANFFISIILILVVFIIALLFFRQELKQKQFSFWIPFTIILMSFGTKYLANYWVSGSVKSNNTSHIFLMGRMLDSGVLKSFLDDKCAEKNYAFCDCKDSLPENSRKLLWDASSPFYKHGGWLNSEKNYNKILKGIVGSPKHLSLFIYNSALSTISQLFQSDMTVVFVDDWYQTPESAPYQAISAHFPHELKPYLQSKQNTNLWGEKLDFTFQNLVYNFLLILSSLFLIAVLTMSSIRKWVDRSSMFLLLYLFIANFINAFVVATFANVYSRLQVRFSWLVIFACCLVALNIIEKYRQTRTDLKSF